MQNDNKYNSSSSSNSNSPDSLEIQSHFDIIDSAKEMLCVICFKKKTPLVCRTCAALIERRRSDYNSLKNMAGSGSSLSSPRK